MTDPDDVAGDILRAVHRLGLATLGLFAIVVGVAVFVYVDGGNKSDALARATEQTTAALAKSTERTNAALCTFRADVASRAEQTREFLREHPEGFAGIPVAQLRQSLEGQERTVRSLATLPCPAAELP